MVRFFDTSSLLSSQINDLRYERFFISVATLRELENIKVSPNKTPEVKYKARSLVRYLDANHSDYTAVIDNDSVYDLLDKYHMPHTNDNVILASAALVTPDVVYSEDLCQRLIGKNVFGLVMESLGEVEEETDGIYRGYRVFTGDEDGYIAYMATEPLENPFVPNEYIIFENTETGKTSEMRFDGEKFVPLKLPPSTVIKGKNALQRCALDLLNNKSVTVAAVLGGYGSGKTMLSIHSAVYQMERGLYSKVLGVREASGEGKPVGYLPGSFTDKTEMFFKPLAQQFGIGGADKLRGMMSRESLEVNIPFYMKGTTYNDTIMVVDEAEDLTEAQLRLIGTRVGSNSRIFFAGDYAQSLTDKTISNPLIQMCHEFKGNPMFGCIYLEEDVRSETSKMFATLFKK